MEALVAESHALGRRVMCHALGGPGLRTALEAGVDTIEHGCYLDEEPTLLGQMAVQGTFFVPTLTVYVYHRESPSPHVRERAADALPAPRGERAAGRSSWACRSRRAPTRAATAIPKNALELKYLVEAGLTPMQALRAATQWAAQCLGLERQVGTIEKGRLADLVVVERQPARRHHLLLDPARIELVYKGGAICADRRVTPP